LLGPEYHPAVPDWLLPVALLMVGLICVGPILAIVAIVRMRELDRRLRQLEAPRPEPIVPLSAPVTAPSQPAPVPQPERTFDWETIIAGRWLNRVGLLAVTIGVSYFLKLAIDNDWIGPSGQVALGVLLGASLLASSVWFLKRGYGYFADGITGLGAAVLYLSCWAAGSYYHLLSVSVAFIAMIVVTAAMLAIAFGRNSQPVAVMALIGGFLTPQLVSTGHDAQVVLFGYLAVVNAALLPAARAREWRALEAPAFLLTQLYFWGWFAQFYTAERLGSTTAFAALFFAEFAAVPAIRGRRTGSVHAEQACIILANAAAALGACAAMMWTPHRWLLTLAALVLAAAHVALAFVVPRRGSALSEARLLFAATAIMLLTAVVPIRLGGRWITMGWAVEAGTLMWAGLTYRVALLRAIAFGLFAVVFVRLLVLPIRADQFLLNPRFFAELVAIASGGVAVWIAARRADVIGHREGSAFRLLALAVSALAVWAMTTEVHVYFRPSPFVDARPAVDQRLAEGLTISLVWAAYAGVLMVVGMRRAVSALRWQGLVVLGLTTGKVFLYDLAELRGVYRVVSSIALGAVLLLVSFLYQRSVAARVSATAAENEIA